MEHNKLKLCHCYVESQFLLQLLLNVLSYHLASRPKWINDLKGKTSIIKSEDGVIYTGNPKVLKKICPGIYGTIKPIGICMIGAK